MRSPKLPRAHLHERSRLRPRPPAERLVGTVKEGKTNDPTPPTIEYHPALGLAWRVWSRATCKSQGSAVRLSALSTQAKIWGPRLGGCPGLQETISVRLFLSLLHLPGRPKPARGRCLVSSDHRGREKPLASRRAAGTGRADPQPDTDPS